MGDDVSFWKRYKTLVLFLTVLVIVFWLVYILRSVLLPFLVGLVFAYLLLPVIKWVEQRLPPKGKWMGAKRIFLILLVFILAISLLVLFIGYVYVGIRDSFSNTLSQSTQYISDGVDNIQKWVESIRKTAPPQYQQQIDSALDNISSKLGETLQGVFTSGIAMVPDTIGMVAGFLSLPFFLFFLLKDSESLGAGFYSLLPTALAVHARNMFKIMDNVLGNYIRAQLVIGSATAVFMLIGLLIIGIKLAAALAVFAGIMEVIPVIGPWMAAVFGVLVTLAVAPDKVIWVVLLYGFVNLAGNLLLVPRINGGFLRINTAVLMVVLVLGASLGGIWGMVIAAPLTALFIEIYKYIRSNAGSEEATPIIN